MGVVDQFEIFKLKLVNVHLFRVEFEEGEGVWVSSQLVTKWFDMIRVDVSIAKGMNEFTWLETANLGQHASKQSIARDIEGHAKTKVARSLIHLARKFSIGGHVELG